MSGKLNIRELIHNFYNDPNVIRLQNYYNSLSFMEILGVSRNEKVHSSFLAWLFDSKINYNLGTKPLELLLELLFKEKHDKNFPVSINEEDILLRKLDISQPEKVETEYPLEVNEKNSYVDIYIPFVIKEKKYALIIENKVKAKENQEKKDNGKTYMQTDKYYEYFSKKKDQTEYIYVFLSPEHKGKIVQASNNQFINISYLMIVKDIINVLLENDKINEQAKIYLNEYLKILYKPNASDIKNSEIVLAISNFEIDLRNKIKEEHKELGILLGKNENNLTEEEKSILTSFNEYNQVIILAIWEKQRSKNKNRTFAELGIEKGEILYLASGAGSSKQNENNLFVRTIDNQNTVEYIKDNQTMKKTITAAAKDLAGKTCNTNGFQWFIYKNQNLEKMPRNI